MKSRRELLGLAAALVGGATLTVTLPAAAGRQFARAEEVESTVTRAWFALVLDLVQQTRGYSPPVAARAFAYLGLACYEAVVPGMPGHRSVAEDLPGLALPAAGRNTAYDWREVANAALARLSRRLFPTVPAERIEGLEAAIVRGLRSGLPPGVFDRSEDRGRAVAEAVFAWSRGDGGHEGYLANFPPYDVPTGPGLWTPTPPAFLPPLQPFWGQNRCLVISSGGAVVPGDPPVYSEEPGSAFHSEALEVYETVRDRTPEQEAIARFWSDDPGLTPTPAGHSLSIATQVLEADQASLAVAADTYLRIGLAVSDAFVACWHEKYRYLLLRPVTYLRRLVDPDWLPPLVTPPFPEYPSGHSVQSGAAFQVLTDLFGDNHAFVDHTHDFRGLPPRAFGSFLEAADEAALSRLYGGIHFRTAIVNGVEQGRQIGRAAATLRLTE